MNEATSNRSTDPGISCATDGHLWNGLGYCIMCKAVRPDWECSECGEPCNASVPHTSVGPTKLADCPPCSGTGIVSGTAGDTVWAATCALCNGSGKILKAVIQ